MKLLLIMMCFGLLVACGNGAPEPEPTEPDKPGNCSKDCNQIKPKEEKDLSKHPFYNTLHGTDCSIPEGTEIVHYPMMHPVNRQLLHLSEESADKLETLFDFKTAISYSSFNFLKLVQQYPSALVFSELAWTQDMVEETFYLFLSSFKRQEDNEFFDEFSYIKSVDSYEDLHSDSLKLLSQLTGVMVAVIAGVVDEIYPATTMFSLEEVLVSYWGKYDTDALSVSERQNYLQKRILVLSDQFNKETDKVKKNKLKEMAYQIYKEVYNLMKLNSNYVTNYREKLLFESVENVISQQDNSNRLVIINYGAAHDFSDDFRYYNFYTLPYACTISEPYLSSHQFTILLIGMYEQIAVIDLTDKEDILEILFSEIMNRINHLSEEGRKDLKNILDNTSKVASGITSSIEVTTLAMRAYLLARSSDSDQNRFEDSFNHYISLSDSDREKLNEVFTEKLQIIRHQKKLQNRTISGKSELITEEDDGYSDNGFGSSDGDNGFSKPLPAEAPEGYLEEDEGFLDNKYDGFSENESFEKEASTDTEGHLEEDRDGSENEGIWESVKDWWNSW